MKVAMVSEHASPLAVVGGVDAGGQNVHVAALSRALADRGHEVVVYTRRDCPSLPARVPMGPGVVVEHLDAGPAAPIAKDDLLPYVPELARSLAARLAADRPDVLHGHFWMSGMACADAVRSGLPGGPVPFVQTFHALGVVKQRWQGGDDTSPAERVGIEAALLHRADRVVATCRDEVQELVMAGADRSRLDVVPCGVDTAHFTPEGAAEPTGVWSLQPAPGQQRRARLLVLGRLVPRKGVDDAIAALAQLPEAELVVAGGPPASRLYEDAEVVRLLALAEKLGVRDRVTLLGCVPRSGLPALIRSADIALCLPWYEPFGIVPLEAMACGVPVVGTAVGGLLDTVVDGGTGTLLPVHRPDLVAAAVADLLADEERLAANGRAGVQWVRDRFAWPRVAAATEQSYERAIAQRAAHRSDRPGEPGQPGYGRRVAAHTSSPMSSPMTSPTSQEALR